jgi:hypothetical protein
MPNSIKCSEVWGQDQQQQYACRAKITRKWVDELCKKAVMGVYFTKANIKIFIKFY